MLTRFPDDLPTFGAFAAGAGFLAYGFTALYGETHFGRPSSTMGLGYLFVPIWAVVYALVGLAVGVLIRAICRRTRPEAPGGKRTRGLQLSLFGVVLFASLCGAAAVIISERQARPAILIDLGKIEHSFVPNFDVPVRNSTQVLGRDEVAQHISWGQNDSSILIDGLRVQLNDRRRPPFVDLEASGLDYLNEIHVAPVFARGNLEPLLVVVIAGRATGRRALVTVLSPEYKIIFQERVERFWELASQPLEIRRDATDGSEIAVIGPNCAKSLVIKPKSVAP